MMQNNMDAEQIASFFATWLASVSMRAAHMLTNGKSPAETPPPAARTRAASEAAAAKAPSPSPELWPADPVDGLGPFELSQLTDGRLQKRYRDGTVRVENPQSGVVTEERSDGSLLVSLPTGRLLYQEYPSEPLLAYNTQNPDSPPSLAGVGLVTLPGDQKATPVYNFRDDQGVHLVALESLRYFRVRQPAALGLAS